MTLSWWTELKKKDEYKVKGKVAAETDFEKKLKIYDQLRDGIISPATCKKAAQALTEVENARQSSTKALEKDFPKLSVFCSPNSRVLLAKLTEEKTFLEAKNKEVTAMQALGSAQMQGLGPGGGNLRQKNFERVQAKAKELYEGLKKTPQLKKELMDTYVTFLKDIEKEVSLYCKDRPAANQFRDDYLNTIEGFKTVKEKFGTSKATEAMKTIGTQLDRMTKAQYVP